MFRDLLMSLGLLHIEISAKDGKRIEYIKGSIEDIENLIEKLKPMSNITDKEIEKLAIKAYGNDFVRGEGYIAGYKQRLWEEAALPVKILSEKEFNTIISTQLFNNIRSSQFKKGMYAGYLETVSKEYISVNEMSNITEEIEKLSGIMSKLGEAHNMLAKTSLSKEEYQPISGLLAKAKVELSNFYNAHKAALQNKVSNVSAEEVLFNRIVSFKKIEDKNDEYFFPYKSSDEMVKQESICKVFIGAMQEYASIVNEREELCAYEILCVVDEILLEKSKEAGLHVDFSDNDYNGDKDAPMDRIGLIDYLFEKVNERKDNAGINDAIEFADWLNKNASRNAVGSWVYFGNMFYTKTSKELYDIFKSEL